MGDLADELLEAFQVAFLRPEGDEEVAARFWEILRLNARGEEWDAFVKRLFVCVKAEDGKIKDRCQKYLVKALQSAEALRRS
jgi:hypothetical protein